MAQTAGGPPASTPAAAAAAAPALPSRRHLREPVVLTFDKGVEKPPYARPLASGARALVDVLVVALLPKDDPHLRDGAYPHVIVSLAHEAYTAARECTVLSDAPSVTLSEAQVRDARAQAVNFQRSREYAALPPDHALRTAVDTLLRGSEAAMCAVVRNSAPN